MLLLLAQRCGFTKMSLLLTHAQTHKSATDHNGPFSIQPGLLSKHHTSLLSISLSAPRCLFFILFSRLANRGNEAI